MYRTEICFQPPCFCFPCLCLTERTKFISLTQRYRLVLLPAFLPRKSEPTGRADHARIAIGWILPDKRILLFLPFSGTRPYGLSKFMRNVNIRGTSIQENDRKRFEGREEASNKETMLEMKFWCTLSPDSGFTRDDVLMRVLGKIRCVFVVSKAIRIALDNDKDLQQKI